ncbi:Phosphoribosyl-ATP pyrophosphatase [Rubripirellula obstinata]|uniref:Phosphoribosyl-ATP pyrophosphatase n=1 Tax=Rubripirellula obstinata TaxID=406547 RepID=A0A5B1CMR6_9BACT|nr:phosphoribosyl-ATP diphosphatase [Rubripirellula obstinata]KAA1261591.1 Phosphoribosyl-ATP pyrophosphatase [Rubripirellula obstinata]
MTVPNPESSDLESSDSLEALSRLMQTLRDRAQQMPEGSYTTKLMAGGSAKIGGKIREEAEELIEAADESGDQGREHFIYEAGDLIYHTMVMLAWRGVDLTEVAAELARREGTSGLTEKANRKNNENVP